MIILSQCFVESLFKVLCNVIESGVVSVEGDNNFLLKRVPSVPILAAFFLLQYQICLEYSATLVLPFVPVTALIFGMLFL